MNHLQNFIKITLQETAKTVQDAKTEHLALCYYKSGRDGKVVLYDPAVMGHRLIYNAHTMKNLTDEQTRKSNEMWGKMPIHGFAVLIDPVNPSWGASELSIAAATPGYGPLLHDIVMTIFGSFIVDRRESVSEEERKLVRFYYERRDDVQKLPLDDVDHPKTKTPEDDGILQSPKTKENFLNYAYKLQTKLNISQLKANHTKFLKLMAQQETDEMYYLTDPDAVEEIIFRKGFSFFSERYETVPYDKRDLRKGWLKKK